MTQETNYLRYRLDDEPSEGIVSDPILPKILAQKDKLFLIGSVLTSVWGEGDYLIATTSGPSFPLYESLYNSSPYMIAAGLVGVGVYCGSKIFLGGLQHHNHS